MSQPSQASKSVLKFVSFSSCISPSFWFELSRAKLDEYKLNDDFRSIIGLFSNASLTLPPIVNFDYSSFEPQQEPKLTTISMSTLSGKLKCFNTINEFNQLDKNKFLDELGQKVRKSLN
jgi:hypothetical protein